MTVADISKMTVLERIQIMEALWDSLTHESTELESPQWHRGVLAERKRKIDSGKAEFISLEELKSKREK